MRTLRFVISLSLGILLPLAIQLRVRRGLSAEQRAAAWNAATWGAALYAFGPLSMVGFLSVVARVAPLGWLKRLGPAVAGVLGGAAGVVVAAAVMALVAGVDGLIARALGLPE